MTGCSSDTPSISNSCSDPAYRAAHPDECAGFNVLLIVPEYALTESGQTVAYKAILRANGKEIELEQGLEWFSSNVGAAVVNQLGVATGVTSGISTISVTWQDLEAFAQLECVVSCQETNQHFAILIDNSKSMAQAFGGSWATKLSFSKSIAADFCDTINYSKDDVAAWKFSDDADLLIDFGVDAAAARAAIQTVSLSSAHSSNLADSLQEVINALPTTGVRAVVLFSDGEYSGSDPQPIADAFRESGGFLIIVAVRAWGDAFEKLANMASGGFLLSAYPATGSDILESLSGLKSFTCRDGCDEVVGTAPHAKLNYTGLIQWELVQDADYERCLDLCGLGVWDVYTESEQGLYLDGAGTANENGIGVNFSPMKIRTIDPISIEDGKDYEFIVNIAGNHVDTPGSFQARISIVDAEDGETELAFEVVTIATPEQLFTEYTVEYTPTDDIDVKLIIEQVNKDGNIGLLYDDVSFVCTTDDETLFEDSFDDENPTTIEPNPSNYGCISAPPGAQSADPTPPTPRVTE